ncbi:hypothetical protein G7067_04610 [Leucobacter insecticola]|uniref:Uncharacterized protein n=1 Tax=Leucobacter insecticola TaxID=2714934 RepID=A0A6G8FHV0_9MICO|nr:DUF6541 family protein [Leucobacter insecticola]QIM15859.1 hypothetical protein G7067_04610 [Leucobacter insecticola]
MVVSVLLLYIPGLATGYFLGLRRIWWWAFAPLFSVGSYALLAVVVPWLGLPWSLGTAGAGVIAVSAFIVLAGRVLLRSRFAAPEERPYHWAWGAGPLVFAGTGLLFIGCVGIGDPNAISQSWDSVYHHGSLRFVLDTNNASPFHLPAYTSPEKPGFYYPGGWHAIVSLVAMAGGGNIPLAMNAFNMVVVALVWPAGIMLFTRQLVRTTPVTLVGAGVLAAAFPAFPLNTLAYGIIYPFFLGMALLPAALAAVLQVLGLSRTQSFGPLRLRVALALFATGTVALSHPSAFTGLLVFSTVAASVALSSSWRSATVRRRVVNVLLFLVFLFAAYKIFVRMRTSWWWPAQTSLGDAAFQAFTSSILGSGLPLVMTVLVAIGILTAIVRRERFGIAAALIWCCAVALYIIAAGASTPALRLIVNPWFADVPRLAALLVVAVIPLSVLGLNSLSVALSQSRVGKTGAGLTVGVALISILLTTGYPRFVPLLRLVHDGQSASYIDSIPPDDRRLLGGRNEEGKVPINNVLSDDERTLISRLHEHVPKGAVIAGNPWTGTPYAYSLAGYSVLLTYQKSFINENAKQILDTFALTPDSPETCSALEQTGVRYILDFGTREVESGDHRYPGIENLDDNPAVQLIDQQGEAKLFKIISCGLS